MRGGRRPTRQSHEIASLAMTNIYGTKQLNKRILAFFEAKQEVVASADCTCDSLARGFDIFGWVARSTLYLYPVLAIPLRGWGAINPGGFQVCRKWDCLF